MDDRGRTVPVALGDEVVLTLPENPTTGVRWAPPEDDALGVIRDDNLPGEGGIGAAGLRRLVLRPARPGRLALRLLRRQAWESEDTADLAYEVTLDVR